MVLTPLPLVIPCASVSFMVNQLKWSIDCLFVCAGKASLRVMNFYSQVHCKCCPAAFHAGTPLCLMCREIIPLWYLRCNFCLLGQLTFSSPWMKYHMELLHYLLEFICNYTSVLSCDQLWANQNRVLQTIYIAYSSQFFQLGVSVLVSRSNWNWSIIL